MTKYDYKFDIVVVDPPWQYKNGNTGKNGKSSSSNKYDTLSNYDIKHKFREDQRLTILEENCTIFMWTTNSMIRTAIDIMNCWFFKEKTLITWIKKNYGLGNHFRGKTEHVIFGTKGKVPALYLNRPNLLMSPKTLKHSEKPQEFYDLVYEYAIALTKKLGQTVRVLELYARTSDKIKDMPGIEWVQIGREITGNDIEEDLDILKANANLSMLPIS